MGVKEEKKQKQEGGAMGEWKIAEEKIIPMSGKQVEKFLKGLRKWKAFTNRVSELDGGIREFPLFERSFNLGMLEVKEKGKLMDVVVKKQQKRGRVKYHVERATLYMVKLERVELRVYPE